MIFRNKDYHNLLEKFNFPKLKDLVQYIIVIVIVQIIFLSESYRNKYSLTRFTKDEEFLGIVERGACSEVKKGGYVLFHNRSRLIMQYLRSHNYSESTCAFYDYVTKGDSIIKKGIAIS